jgi:ABC-2 type transport system permease protein
VSGPARLARVLPTLLRVGFAETIAYRGEFLIWILSTNMPIIMLLLWSAVAREAPVGRYGEAEFGAYFLTTLVVRLNTSSWVVWEMNYEIRQGALAMRLLRPLHPFVSYASENLAAVPFRLLLSLPIIVGGLLWLGTRHFSPDPVVWSLWPLALGGAWASTFCFMAIIGTLAFFWDSTVALFHFWLGLFFVFSGYTIPLELFPAWLRHPVQYLPFRFQLSFPVEMLLGQLGRKEVLVLLAVQWGYAAIFLAASLLLWRRGLRRFAAFGG